uniref:Uncharacterized protein At2g10470 n=1 Tax=Arabidopsis thaliana TaxID=3702 RepID=Q9SI90_ARATH|nr:hypothetical protein [Arabidopsis thaliana]AAM15472.1 hypothetical protein [Arabidopsis thaliana]
MIDAICPYFYPGYDVPRVLEEGDAYGVVVRVGNIRRPDFVPQASENPTLSQFLEFEIKNTWGKSLICVARGYTCDLFVQLWRKLGLNLGYQWTFGMNPTNCVLRFWNVDDHEGIIFNQSYPEINMDRITTQFFERMQPPELGEVVDEN